MVFNKRILLGLPIYDTIIKDLVNILDEKIQRNIKTIIFGISAGAYGRIRFRKDLAGIYYKMDIIIAEGAGIPILGKLFNVKIREHIGLTNLSYQMLKLANENGYKVLLFGASEEINKVANINIATNYPNINLCKGINGYFNQDDVPKIIDNINKESPDILLIGMTYPLKERFAVKYKDQLSTKIIIPCGGAIDVFAGKAKRIPIKIKGIPINWLYRFLQEPIRLFKPIIVTVLYSIFWVFPILYFKHITRLERNPSIIDFFNIDIDLWNPLTDPIRDRKI